MRSCAAYGLIHAIEKSWFRGVTKGWHTGLAPPPSVIFFFLIVQRAKNGHFKKVPPPFQKKVLATQLRSSPCSIKIAMTCTDIKNEKKKRFSLTTDQTCRRPQSSASRKLNKEKFNYGTVCVCVYKNLTMIVNSIVVWGTLNSFQSLGINIFLVSLSLMFQNTHSKVQKFS